MRYTKKKNCFRDKEEKRRKEDKILNAFVYFIDHQLRCKIFRKQLHAIYHK